MWEGVEELIPSLCSTRTGLRRSSLPPMRGEEGRKTHSCILCWGRGRKNHSLILQCGNGLGKLIPESCIWEGVGKPHSFILHCGNRLGSSSLNPGNGEGKENSSLPSMHERKGRKADPCIPCVGIAGKLIPKSHIWGGAGKLIPKSHQIPASHVWGGAGKLLPSLWGLGRDPCILWEVQHGWEHPTGSGQGFSFPRNFGTLGCIRKVPSDHVPGVGCLS